MEVSELPQSAFVLIYMDVLETAPGMIAMAFAASSRVGFGAIFTLCLRADRADRSAQRRAAV
jgi:hypothetical protein